MRHRLSVAAFMISGCLSANAARFYVRAGATGANTGQSWADAFTDLQSACSGDEWGDEIWVAAGTYRPGPAGNRDVGFNVGAKRLYGGFAGGETALDQRDWIRNPTILSGDLLGDDGPNFANRADNAYHVVTIGGLGVLDGVTIRGGQADDSRYSIGGGVIVNGGGVVTVAHCRITDNYAANSGGGMGFRYTNLNDTSVVDCEFRGNRGAWRHGGGLSAPAPLRVEGCRFLENAAGDGGGGLAIITGGGSPAYVQRCIFLGNESYRGGGLYFEASAEVAHCVFSGNTAMTGGACCGIKPASITLTACTISGNLATGSFGGVYGEMAVSLRNSIVWGNPSDVVRQVRGSTLHARCSVVEGGLPAGAVDEGGNLALNPLFVDAANPAGADGIPGTPDDGLRLTAGGPCLDAADATLAGATDADIAGAARPQGGGLDMGAYESAASPLMDPGNGGTKVLFRAAVASATLIVRGGPGTAFAIRGQLVKDQIVPVYETKNGWYRIVYQNAPGWISATNAVKVPAALYPVKVTVASLNVRTGPGSTYAKVGTLSGGTVVKVYAESGGWYKIIFGGCYRWILGSYTVKA